MNALYELVGYSISSEEFEELKKSKSFDNYRINSRSNSWGKYNKNLIDITPLWGSPEVKDWLSTVLFARIDNCELTSDEEPIILFLPSNRTEEQEKEFINILSEIEYDPGYGLQELYGVVVFKNGTWLDRWEYDGSEGWKLNTIPQEKDYSNVKVDENE